MEDEDGDWKKHGRSKHERKKRNKNPISESKTHAILAYIKASYVVIVAYLLS